MIQPIQLFSTLAPKKVQSNKNNQQFYSVNFATKPDTFERNYYTEEKAVMLARKRGLFP